MDPETRGGRMSSKGEEAVERIRRALPPERPSDIGQLPHELSERVTEIAAPGPHGLETILGAYFDMLSYAVPELFLVVIAFIWFRAPWSRRRFSHRRPWAFRGLWPRPPWAWRWVFRGLRRHLGGTIVGRAYVTDGEKQV